ncbi:MAG: hypothetical protein C4575_00735 [Desulforudis sp.]|nr:MAG: hypothetical protein C4575_00735 [Desulforudis sp.]
MYLLTSILQFLPKHLLVHLFFILAHQLLSFFAGDQHRQARRIKVVLAAEEGLPAPFLALYA